MKSLKSLLTLLFVCSITFSGFAKGHIAVPEHDTIAIKKAAMDYIEGAYSGDADRMTKAIHPEIQKVIPAQMRGTGKDFLQYSNYTLLIEGTVAALGNMPKEEWNIDYQLLHWDKNIATVRITSKRYQDYCHLAKINGEWKIVNVLWRLNQ